MSIFGKKKTLDAEERHAQHIQQVSGAVDKRLRRLERGGDDIGTQRRTGMQVVKGIGRGFGDIAKSLATPTTNKRPRIAQLPLRDADISQPIDLEKLKHPSLRGKSIRGDR